MANVRLLSTPELSELDRAALRRLLDDAFEGDFTDDDWAHALGGSHALIEDSGAIVAHAAVVERRIQIGSRVFRAGFVEAVAAAPDRQRRGLGTAVLAAATELILDRFELGALSSGEWGFYERLGWERWRGPSHVRSADGTIARSPDDDDGVMVLRCPASRDIHPGDPITCDQREGDSW